MKLVTDECMIKVGEEAFIAYKGSERRDDYYSMRGLNGDNSDIIGDECQVNSPDGTPIVYDVVLKDAREIDEQLLALGTYAIMTKRR